MSPTHRCHSAETALHPGAGGQLWRFLRLHDVQGRGGSSRTYARSTADEAVCVNLLPRIRSRNGVRIQLPNLSPSWIGSTASPTTPFSPHPSPPLSTTPSTHTLLFNSVISVFTQLQGTQEGCSLPAGALACQKMNLKSSSEQSCTELHYMFPKCTKLH